MGVSERCEGEARCEVNEDLNSRLKTVVIANSHILISVHLSLGSTFYQLIHKSSCKS